MRFSCQPGAYTLAHRSDLSRIATRSIRPFSNPGPPLGLRGFWIAWEKVQMQVGNLISKDKEVDVLCSLTGFECPAQTGHEQAESLSFLVGLLR